MLIAGHGARGQNRRVAGHCNIGVHANLQMISIGAMISPSKPMLIRSQLRSILCNEWHLLAALI